LAKAKKLRCLALNKRLESESPHEELNHEVKYHDTASSAIKRKDLKVPDVFLKPGSRTQENAQDSSTVRDLGESRRKKQQRLVGTS